MMDNNDNVLEWMTFYANMANIDYSSFDSLVSTEELVTDVHNKVNLYHTEELEYRGNLSKQDIIIGGKHLALADSRANGKIISLDTKILYFNNDGKRVSIWNCKRSPTDRQQVMVWMFCSKIKCWIDQVVLATRNAS